MGFPEVIFPGDIRNDLYLTLVNGEFSKGSKGSDKNIEVTAMVCDDKGTIFPDVISIGSGVPPINEYKSMIYYHEDKPKWNETFKVYQKTLAILAKLRIKQFSYSFQII